MYQNEFDKIKTGIPEKHYKNKGDNLQGAFLGGCFKICTDSRLMFEMSGKICASSYDFGSITEDNIISALERFEKCSGIVFDTDFSLRPPKFIGSTSKKTPY